MLLDADEERVSVLFNEPKLLKSCVRHRSACARRCFSALQRAEIAEIVSVETEPLRFERFSALQRAEIAEMPATPRLDEPQPGFSALQRAEIAEIRRPWHLRRVGGTFQCSSTSRNC